MAIQNINDYAGMWANGVNIGELWDKVKAKFVSGAHDQSDATAYPATWKQQARANIGLTIGLNQIWYGSAANTIGTITTTALGRALLGASIDKDKIWYGSAANTLGQLPVTTLGKWLLNSTIASGKMWYASANNTLSEVTTSAFGRGLLNANSDGTATMVANLFAEYAQKDEDGDIIKQTYANYLDISGTSLRLLDKQSTRVALATVALNAKNGLLKLDNTGSAGKIPLVHIPDSIMGQLTYGGTITAYVSANNTLTVSITTGAKAILEQNTGRSIGSKTVRLSALAHSSSSFPADDASYIYFNYEDCTGIYFIWTDAALASHTGEPDYRVWPSGGPRYQAGDWLISNDTKWDKVDNTDAVTGVKGSNESAFRLGNVSIDALDVRALATYLTNTTQTVADKVQFNKDIWSLGGVATYGISDLSAGGGGGGGLSGTIIRNWSNYQGAETEVLGANLGMRGFRMSGYSFQVNKPAVGADNWQTEFTLGTENIPDLPLTQITGTTELRKIETLAGTGTPSGYLTRAANGNWSFVTIYAPTAVGTNGQVLKSTGSGNPSWVDQSTLSVGSAAKLTSAVSIWGQNFDGSTSISMNTPAKMAYLRFKNNEDNNDAGYVGRGSASNNNIQLMAYGGNRLQLGANDSTGMFFDLANNVGIGTTSPDTKLHVNGNIKGAQLISTQAQGTAPLVVTSNTLVSNLNADLLDGKHDGELTANRMRTEIKADQEFVYRQSPQTIDADSLVINKFKGRTVAWNQIFPGWRNGDSKSVSTSASGTLDQQNNYGVIGHKYYLRFEYWGSSFSGSAYTRILQRDSTNITMNVTSTRTVLSQVYTCASVNTINVFVTRTAGTLYIDNTYQVDLTLMFGSGKEPTAAQFEALFQDKYYPQNAGTLHNNDAKAIETGPLGFNIWNEEWEYGDLDNSGQEVSISGQNEIRNVGYISVKPSTTYYFYAGSSGNNDIFFYDANKSFVSLMRSANVKNQTFTTPSTARYMRFYQTGYSLYKNDICINESDAAKNGTYEPYEKFTIDLNFDSIQVKSHNIWDEDMAFGYGLSGSTGEIIPVSGYQATRNMIAVQPSTSYYFKSSQGASYVCFFDEKGTFLPSLSLSSLAANTSFTTPSGAYFMRMQFTGYGNTYNNDICINESSSFNGQYEPHGILTINGLKQADGAFDEIIGSKLIKRVGFRNLGDLNYVYNSTYKYFQTSLPDAKIRAYEYTGVNLISAKYISISAVSYTAIPNGRFKMDGGNYNLLIADYDYTDADVYKAAMATKGIYVHYELATPIEYELASPIPDTMPAGTTERIISDRLPVTPFACDMTYGANPKDILASAVPFSRLQGVRLERGAFTMSTQNDSNWYLVTLGDKKLYLRFTVNTGAFKLEMASDDTENPEYSKSFEFATLSTADINAICV